jgi:ParB family chromosome partitioning protein
MGHAKAILSLTDNEKQQLLHEIIKRDALTVRQTEAAAAKLSKRAKSGKLVHRTKDFHLEELSDNLQEKLNSRVQIQPLGKKKGRITIDYYDWADLDRLYNLITK